MNGNLTISNFLNEICDDWQDSKDCFPKNVIREQHWPISFFGNPATALVATIGANPSSEEFSTIRRWPKVTKENRGASKERLKTYFNRKPAADDWFDPWTIGLALLDCSYKEGTAAHFDVSYRPTTAIYQTVAVVPEIARTSHNEANSRHQAQDGEPVWFHLWARPNPRVQIDPARRILGAMARKIPPGFSVPRSWYARWKMHHMPGY